jgi:predicted TIM-barrel fold metal-dependent hydrolase
VAPAEHARGVVARVSAVDAHMHVLRRDAPLVAERHSKPARDATVDELVGVLDAHGISHALLTAPSFYGADNSLLLEALDAYPVRLRGTVILHPDTEERALQRLARRGVVGVRFNWIRRDALPDLAAGGYPALLARVRALGWHVEVYLEGRKLAHVLPRLRDVGVTVVLDHFGAPDPALGLRDPGFVAALAGLRAGDTFVKLSAAYRLGGADPQAYVDALLAAGGPAQLVWASDWPFVGHESSVSYRQCVDALEAWIPDAATRHVVRVDTPARLFRFDRPRGLAAGDPLEESRS